MDLIRIGRYIADKRKALGLTQRQLAERLGMSDKSVSKWERGVCLPDVSVYLPLCEALGISLNEFLAGEDISRETLPQKAEDNLLSVTRAGHDRQKSLRKIIYLLLAVIAVIAAVLSVYAWRHIARPQNYIIAAARESAEARTARLVWGNEGAFMFEYYTQDVFASMTVYMYEYRFGRLVQTTPVASFACDGLAAADGGLLVFLPDTTADVPVVRLIMTEGYAKYDADIPLAGGPADLAGAARSFSYVEEIIPIQPGAQQGLLALSYGRDKLSGIPAAQLANGNIDTDNDCVYYFTVQFDV